MSEHNPYLPPDDANPYVAPRSELRPRLPGPAGLPSVDVIEPFSIGGVLNRAWRMFQKRLGTCVGVVLGVFGINIGVAVVIAVILSAPGMAGDNSVASTLLQLAMQIASNVLALWLTIGQTVALLKVARDQDATFGEVFGGGRFFWRYLGASIVFGLLVIPIFLACVTPAAVVGVATLGVQDPMVKIFAILIGGLVGAVVFIAIILRFYQFPFVLVDRDCGVMESLQASYELTRGKVPELFLLSILTGLIGFSGVLGCVFGLLLTIPLSMLIATTTYVCLIGPRPLDAPKPVRSDIEFLDFGP